VCLCVVLCLFVFVCVCVFCVCMHVLFVFVYAVFDAAYSYIILQKNIRKIFPVSRIIKKCENKGGCLQLQNF